MTVPKKTATPYPASSANEADRAKQYLERQDVTLIKYCCHEMKQQAEHACQQHPNRFDCPDCLIHYSKERNLYGIIIHDGGSSFVAIRHCPWCGTELPKP
ncbi:MAG TPA: hypothetical protein VFE47_16755 [Tepidisphaeraceae bacterium]|jgi:hypothetical protein|nr:hypothetical protein [Tepidisphaeraceae bacterium]